MDCPQYPVRRVGYGSRRHHPRRTGNQNARARYRRVVYLLPDGRSWLRGERLTSTRISVQSALTHPLASSSESRHPRQSTGALASDLGIDLSAGQVLDSAWWARRLRWSEKPTAASSQRDQRPPPLP